jgi:hypothetical protein
MDINAQLKQCSRHRFGGLFSYNYAHVTIQSPGKASDRLAHALADRVSRITITAGSVDEPIALHAHHTMPDTRQTSTPPRSTSKAVSDRRTVPLKAFEASNLLGL